MFYSYMFFLTTKYKYNMIQIRNIWRTRYFNFYRKLSSIKTGSRGSIIGVLFFTVLLIIIIFLVGRKPPSYFVTIKLADGPTYKLAVRERSPVGYNKTVVLLHSDWYDSSIWVGLKTLDILFSIGCRVLAIDLPGHGYSGSREGPKEQFDRAVILEHILVKLNATESVLVVPSMSGSYALPLVVRGFLKLKGFIAISPFAAENFSKLEYSTVEIPTLIIYGVDDTFYGATSALYLRNIPNSKVHVILSAGHACYVDNPEEFHHNVVSFLQYTVKTTK